MESKSFKKKKVSFTEILDKNESESEDGVDDVDIILSGGEWI